MQVQSLSYESSMHALWLIHQPVFYNVSGHALIGWLVGTCGSKHGSMRKALEWLVCLHNLCIQPYIITHGLPNRAVFWLV